MKSDNKVMGLEVANTGFVAAGLSLVSLGIICLVLMENQFASGDSRAHSTDYQISQFSKAGAAGMVVIGFGLTAISAAGISKDNRAATDS